MRRPADATARERRILTRRRRICAGLAGPLPALLTMLALSASTARAGQIDTSAIEQAWRQYRAKEFEVGKYPVQWRQHASKRDGIFAGAGFTAPASRQRAWALATDYTDLGASTPGITAVRFLENTPTRQVVQVDLKVLWKHLRLTFEIEQDAPDQLRFRLVNDHVGEYTGLCRFQPDDAGRCRVEMMTRLKPALPVPRRLVLSAERIVMLSGIRSFLQECERPADPPAQAPGRTPNPA